MRSKLLAAALLISLMFLSACSHTNKTNTVASPSAPAIDRIVQKGELVVGVSASQPPLNMKTKKGDIIGMEPELAEMMAEAMGVKLKLVEIPFKNLIEAVQTGEVDMAMSGITVTPKRNMKVAFAGNYFVTGKAVLTKIKTIAAMENPEDINTPKSKLVALRGSTSQMFIEVVLPNAKLTTTNTYDEAIQMVLDGRVDAMFADYQYCLYTLLRYPDKGLISIIAPLTYEPVSIALPADAHHLANWVNNYINALKGSGALKDLKEDWFSDPSWISEMP